MGSSDEDIQTTLVRLGVGKSWHGGGVYADANYIHLGTNNLGSVELARLSIGVEQMVRPEWIVRGGFTTDTIQEWSWGAGESYTGIQGSMIEFGYQYNAAPEMKPELGRFQLFSASVAWAL